MWLYKAPRTAGDPFTIGYYAPSSRFERHGESVTQPLIWQAIADRATEPEAMNLVHYLNGGSIPLDVAMTSAFQARQHATPADEGAAAARDK